MKKKMPLIIMAVVLGLCIAGYFGIKDMEWEDTSNPNATTVDNTQTIGEALEAAEENVEESSEEITSEDDISVEMAEETDDSEETADEADISEDVAVEAD